jgi:hypothetical protein
VHTQIIYLTRRISDFFCPGQREENVIFAPNGVFFSHYMQGSFYLDSASLGFPPHQYNQYVAGLISTGLFLLSLAALLNQFPRGLFNGFGFLNALQRRAVRFVRFGNNLINPHFVKAGERPRL